MTAKSKKTTRKASADNNPGQPPQAATTNGNEAYRTHVEDVVEDMLGVVSAVSEGRFDRYCTAAGVDDSSLSALGLGINVMVSDINDALRKADNERHNLQSVLNCIPDPVFTVDRDMQVTFMNAAAEEMFDVRMADAAGRSCKEVFDTELCAAGCPMKMAAELGEPVSGVEFHHKGVNGAEMICSVSASAMQDMEHFFVGGVEIIRDTTLEKGLELELERRLSEAKAEINEQLDMIERQQYTIAELAAPILDVWENVITVPLVGALDSQRSMEVMEKLLQTIVRSKAQVVIIDLTGVPVVDTHTADHLIRITKAAGLLGTRCIVTGISPGVAQSIVELGMDLSIITTKRTLKEGLREAITQLHNNKGKLKPKATAPSSRS